MIQQILMAIIGLSFGMLVSGGVFTIFVTVGLVPRLAAKTHTNNQVFLYENAICLGTILGSSIGIFDKVFQLGNFVLGHHYVETDLWNLIGTAMLCVFGIFAGIFVGCFALAIAEMLDAIPIFIRRVSLTKGLVVVIAAMALGKLCGSLLYFSQGFFVDGGM